MKNKTSLVVLLVLSLLGITIAQPGIIRSDGTFSINSLGNSTTNVIVPQNLILAKNGMTAVNVGDSFTSYNTKLRTAEHLKLFNWESTQYDITSASCTWGAVAPVSFNTTYIFFGERALPDPTGDQVYTFNHDTGKLSFLQLLDGNPSNMRTIRLNYFYYNNTHFMSRSNNEGSLANPSKLFRLNISNMWSEYQRFPKTVTFVQDIEFCYPPDSPNPFLAISSTSGLSLQQPNASNLWDSVASLSTASHADSICLTGNNKSYLAALNIDATQLTVYKYSFGVNTFNTPVSYNFGGPNWVAPMAGLAAIKYSDPTIGDVFYITVCQMGNGPSFVAKFNPSDNTVKFAQSLPTPATDCTDVDTFMIDSIDYLIIGSGSSTIGVSTTQALYRWNQAVEEWDLISSMSILQGTSSHAVFKDKNSLTWALGCANLNAGVSGVTSYKLI